MRSLIAAALAVAVTVPAHAALHCSCVQPGADGALACLVGGDAQTVAMQDPRVAAPLRRLLGDDYDRVVADLQVAGPVGSDGSALILRGNAAGTGLTQRAVVAVRLLDGAIAAAWLDGLTVHTAASAPGVSWWSMTKRSCGGYRSGRGGSSEAHLYIGTRWRRAALPAERIKD